MLVHDKSSDNADSSVVTVTVPDDDDDNQNNREAIKSGLKFALNLNLCSRQTSGSGNRLTDPPGHELSSDAGVG